MRMSLSYTSQAWSAMGLNNWTQHLTAWTSILLLASCGVAEVTVAVSSDWVLYMDTSRIGFLLLCVWKISHQYWYMCIKRCSFILTVTCSRLIKLIVTSCGLHTWISLSILNKLIINHIHCWIHLYADNYILGQCFVLLSSWIFMVFSHHLYDTLVSVIFSIFSKVSFWFKFLHRFIPLVLAIDTILCFYSGDILIIKCTK